MANNLLKRGETMVASKLRSDAAEEVSITRNPFTTAGVKAVFASRTQPAETGEANVRTETTDRDFLIDAADYVINGTVSAPLKGDIITATIAGVAQKFKVLPLASEPEAPAAGRFGIKLRVHTKFVGNV